MSRPCSVRQRYVCGLTRHGWITGDLLSSSLLIHYTHHTKPHAPQATKAARTKTRTTRARTGTRARPTFCPPHCNALDPMMIYPKVTRYDNTRHYTTLLLHYYYINYTRLHCTTLHYITQTHDICPNHT